MRINSTLLWMAAIFDASIIAALATAVYRGYLAGCVLQ